MISNVQKCIVGRSIVAGYNWMLTRSILVAGPGKLLKH